MRMKEKTNPKPQKTKILTVVALAGTVAVFVAMLVILARTFTQTVLVDTLGYTEDNKIVRLLLKNRMKDEFATETTVDTSSVSSFIDTFLKAVREKEAEIETMAGDYFPGRNTIVKYVNRGEHLLGYDLALYENSSQMNINGYFFSVIGELSSEEIQENRVEPLADLAKVFCDKDIPFLYVEIPSKVCRKTDWAAGIVDFSNENRERMLRQLEVISIPYLDLTDLLHSEGLEHHSLFFRTDHHMTLSSGLWAARHIISYAEQNYGIRFRNSGLQLDDYTEKVYEKVWLGSYGRKVTIEKADAEDFPLLIPKFKTSYSAIWEDSSPAETGDFTILYDYDKISYGNPEETDAYAAYFHDNRPHIHIDNLLYPDGPSVLMIDTSFDNVIAPFMAENVGHLDVIDFRSLTEEQWLEIKGRPYDLVIAATYGIPNHVRNG